MVPPKAALEKLYGTSHIKWLPSRLKMGCFLSLISTYRSPEGPPLIPASPSFDRRIRSSWSTPGWILIDIVRSFWVLPDL